MFRFVVIVIGIFLVSCAKKSEPVNVQAAAAAPQLPGLYAHSPEAFGAAKACDFPVAKLEGEALQDLQAKLRGVWEYDNYGVLARPEGGWRWKSLLVFRNDGGTFGPARAAYEEVNFNDYLFSEWLENAAVHDTLHISLPSRGNYLIQFSKNGAECEMYYVNPREKDGEALQLQISRAHTEWKTLSDFLVDGGGVDTYSKVDYSYPN